MRLFLLFFIFTPVAIFASDSPTFKVELNGPEYREGVITTHQGGVITSNDLRIQARHIIYTNKTEKGRLIHHVFAEGDLMVESGGQPYVGKRLEYDFVTKTGALYEGITAIHSWFLGGEKVALKPDRTVYLFNAYLTTSESQKSDWVVHSRELMITKEEMLRAKNVTFRFNDTPIFWLPAFRSNLGKSSDSSASYGIDWDKGLWPQINSRYRIYSWENLSLFFRLNVRPSKGLGGALESNYLSPNKRTTFLTRNYADRDAFYRDSDPDKPRFHYRLQGLYKSSSEDERSQFLLTYDRLSDKNMQTDFKSDDFEISKKKQTRVEVRNTQDWMIAGIDSRFRINSFQGFKQQLPDAFWTPHPVQIGNTGVISQNRLKIAYLDYVSAKDIEKVLPDFESSRLDTRNEFYRPFRFNSLSFTPLIGFHGIYYNNSRKDHSVRQALLKYQCLLDLTLFKEYSTLRHTLIPYAEYKGLTRPTASPDTPYIFDLHDGYHRLNMIKAGVRNLIYLKKFPQFEPNIILDFHTYSFLGATPFDKGISKFCTDLTWSFPSTLVTGILWWNREQQVLDRGNIGLAWTINENIAFKTEFRHRSRFDWRHDDPENFIMQVTRDIPELLQTPLSDGRNTLLSKLQFKLAPEWVLRLESHIGWGRGGEPSYNEAKIDLITMISTSWRVRLTFVHAPAPAKKNDRFAFGISLIRK